MTDWRDLAMRRIYTKVGDDRFEDEYIGLMLGAMSEHIIYTDDGTERAKLEAMIEQPYNGDVWIESLYDLICGYLHE